MNSDHKAINDKYRKGYELINWEKKEVKPEEPPPGVD